MGHKLRQKTRNKFLQHIPPENLIPNQDIKKREKRRYNRRVSFYRHERSLISNRYLANLATDTKKTSQAGWRAGNGISKALQESNALIGTNLQQSQVQHRENFSFPLKNIIQPGKHHIIEKLHKLVGKSIVHFLTTTATYSFAHKCFAQANFRPEKSELKRKQIRGASLNVQQGTKPAEPALVGPFLSPAQLLPNCPDNSAAAFSKEFNNSLQSFYVQWAAPRIRQEKDPAYGKRDLFTNFLKNQLHNSFWSYLFPIYDLNRKRNKINDQYKNQYCEYKKLSILYGNLSRRTLARSMRRATGEGGEIESKFLSILERRLDVALKRALLFPTIYSARQWIHQGKILVNNQVCTAHGYLLQPADLITLKKKCAAAWKKEWWAHFRVAVKNRALRQKSTRPEKNAMASLGNKFNYGLGRRFFFPPLLMQKWFMWSKLWGNGYFLGNKRCHRWSRGPAVWGNLSHPFFSNSALANYFFPSFRLARKVTRRCNDIFDATHLTAPWGLKKKPQSAVKESNRIGQVSAGHSVNVKQTGLVLSASKLFRRPFTFTIPALQQLSKSILPRALSHYSSLGSRRIREKKSTRFMQFLSAFLFLRQQPNTVDGCFQLRWNKMLTKKKLIGLKRKDWRWSCIKPMHFECSYRRPTVVYLYSPQKLVWPSSISVLLLKKALNC